MDEININKLILENMLNPYTLIMWGFWMICGLAIGITKGKAFAGAVWGFIFGPIGVIVIACAKSKNNNDKSKVVYIGSGRSRIQPKARAPQRPRDENDDLVWVPEANAYMDAADAIAQGYAIPRQGASSSPAPRKKIYIKR